MRISDWSSDVCASDLVKALRQELAERCGAVLRLDRIAAHFVHIDGSAQKRVRLAPDPFVERVVPLVDRENDTEIMVGLDGAAQDFFDQRPLRSEEHTSELQSLMRISYAVFCLQKKTTI